MGKIISIALVAVGLVACGGPNETDYARAPGQTTVIESPGQTTIVTQPSQGAPLRLCDNNKPC
jgi:hypothetical protein